MARNLQYPPSVKPGIPRLGKTPNGWSRVTFGDVLQIVVREASLIDDDEYQLVVARRNRGGIAPRERLLGRAILTKSQFLVHSGDFLISKRQIVHGACGIVPPELHGSVVSNEYAVLHARNGLNLKYLDCYTHSLHFQQTCFHASVGVAVEKMIFRLDEWLRHEINLPPRLVQEYIVDALAQWDLAIEKQRKLIQAKCRLKQELGRQLLFGVKRLPGFKKPWTTVALGEIALINPPISKPTSPDTEVTFLAMADIAEGGGLLTSQVKRYQDVAAGFTAFQDGDILIAKITPCYENGKGALVSGLLNGIGLGSTELHVLRPIAGYCGQFVFFLTMSKPFRTRGAANMTGSAGQKRVPTDFVRQYRFECPPLEEQEQIATVLATADREVALLARKLSLLIEQKNGLMQKLLTGRVKVKV